MLLVGCHMPTLAYRLSETAAAAETHHWSAGHVAPLPYGEIASSFLPF